MRIRAWQGKGKFLRAGGIPSHCRSPDFSMKIFFARVRDFINSAIWVVGIFAIGGFALDRWPVTTKASLLFGGPICLFCLIWLAVVRPYREGVKDAPDKLAK